MGVPSDAQASCATARAPAGMYTELPRAKDRAESLLPRFLGSIYVNIGCMGHWTE